MRTVFLATVLLAGGCAASHVAMPPTPSRLSLTIVHNPKQVTYSLKLGKCHINGNLPDPQCTPGGIDPAVTPDNVLRTICTSGWTATVRPSTTDTNKAKALEYRVYNIPSGTLSELDHLVPLELGGSNDISNLWPEAGSIPNAKDKVENDLHAAVCQNRTTLGTAQQAIATNWQTAEHVLGLR